MFPSQHFSRSPLEIPANTTGLVHHLTHPVSFCMDCEFLWRVLVVSQLSACFPRVWISTSCRGVLRCVRSRCVGVAKSRRGKPSLTACVVDPLMSCVCSSRFMFLTATRNGVHLPRKDQRTFFALETTCTYRSGGKRAHTHCTTTQARST